MTLQIELDPTTEAWLTAEAEHRGLPVAQYAGSLLRNHASVFAGGTGRLTLEDLREMREAMTKGSEDMPVLSLEANDRESYYQDRN
jgi:hypothetical protein